MNQNQTKTKTRRFSIDTVAEFNGRPHCLPIYLTLPFDSPFPIRGNSPSLDSLFTFHSLFSLGPVPNYSPRLLSSRPSSFLSRLRGTYARTSKRIESTSHRDPFGNKSPRYSSQVESLLFFNHTNCRPPSLDF